MKNLNASRVGKIWYVTVKETFRCSSKDDVVKLAKDKGMQISQSGVDHVNAKK